jgi:hypothetical protein
MSNTLNKNTLDAAVTQNYIKAYISYLIYDKQFLIRTEIGLNVFTIKIILCNVALKYMMVNFATSVTKV